MTDNAVIDAAEFRSVLGRYPTGVCAITAMTDEGPAVMIVGTFTSVSLDPPLVGFLPDRKSTSWPKIESAGRFCVNVLGAEQTGLCGQLSSKSPDKFKNIGYELSPLGSPLLPDVSAWIDCEIDNVADAGDHFFVTGLVRHMARGDEIAPMLFLGGAFGRFAAASS